MLLGRDVLLPEVIKPETEDVPVPEFGGVVRVRQWMGCDGDDWDEQIVAHRENNRMVRAISIAVSVVDESGNRVFQATDAQRIYDTWPNSAIRRVFNATQRMNRIGEKRVEDAEKNLPDGQSDSSG